VRADHAKHSRLEDEDEDEDEDDRRRLNGNRAHQKIIPGVAKVVPAIPVA